MLWSGLACTLIGVVIAAFNGGALGPRRRRGSRPVPPVNRSADH